MACKYARYCAHIRNEPSSQLDHSGRYLIPCPLENQPDIWNRSVRYVSVLAHKRESRTNIMQTGLAMWRELRQGGNARALKRGPRSILVSSSHPLWRPWLGTQVPKKKDLR